MKNKELKNSDLELEFIESLSNNQKNKLYRQIVDAILAIIKEKEIHITINHKKSRYMGDILKRGEYEIKKTKDGEEYYVY